MQVNIGKLRIDNRKLGARGFKGLLLGSVTTYAAHHLECPLLLVPFKVD